ncbi:hypothetical protein RD792_010139 [Penstemon davidsonii]|uniref:DNAJ-containing protein X-domain domain-containing protein n=1 Tax=Penstemon davidsonii TaxID=160366 RepID=A0ABR0D1T2_9LAMI|nr:hypothetical protein RD792_010139 [Penstemon davidsonii]
MTTENDVQGGSLTATVNEIKIHGEANPPSQLQGKSVISSVTSRENHQEKTIFLEDLIEPEEIYARIFGSGLFEEFIGQLAMKSAESLRKSEGFDQKKYQHKMRNFQNEREKKLTGILKNRLNLYVQGKKEEFIRCAQTQVSRLSDVAYGVELLCIIGYIYATEAAQELGKKVTYLGVPFVAEWLRNVGHTFKSNFSFGKSEFSILLRLNGINIRNGKGNYTEEEIVEYLDTYEKAMTDCVWKASVVDIEDTLSRVCQMVVSEL